MMNKIATRWLWNEGLNSWTRFTKRSTTTLRYQNNLSKLWLRTTSRVVIGDMSIQYRILIPIITPVSNVQSRNTTLGNLIAKILPNSRPEVRPCINVSLMHETLYSHENIEKNSILKKRKQKMLEYTRKIMSYLKLQQVFHVMLYVTVTFLIDTKLIEVTS